ncbi:MAG: hypothetical protein KatS3mg039_1263 [Candidatus Kapaibacterium sp.]|nr:MAG: hypothetical protein KatS3mg039_1263 [Candidatus Kapabacteria bacterium]
MSRAVSIGDIELDVEIFTEPFACELTQCCGACCTIPGCYGAPLQDSELPVIEELLPRILPLLSPQAHKVIAERGFAERDPTGEWVTATVNDRECVFALVEEGIAYCAFHRLWSAGESAFPKPLSCHLFPIRQMPSGRLFYERYHECAPAAEQGRRTNTTVYRAVRDALRRVYGSAWITSADRMEMSIIGTDQQCQS